MEQAIQTSGRRYSVAEYFEIDADPQQKFEYRDGELLALDGGTESHSLITANVIRSLGNRLETAPCRVYDSNLRVRADRSVRYVYPDALVVCGPREFDPDDPRRMTILNPKVVVEVLSPSTELADRSEKFAFYLRCPTLEEYVMISQAEPRVETYLRQPDRTWSFAYTLGREATARLRSLAIDLPLGEVYARVDLPPTAQGEPSEQR